MNDSYQGMPSGVPQIVHVLGAPLGAEIQNQFQQSLSSFPLHLHPLAEVLALLPVRECYHDPILGNSAS